MGRFTFPLFLIALGIGALLFAGLNNAQVDVEFAFTNVRLGLGLALIIAAVVGFLIGVLVRGAWVAELLSERGRLRRALKSAEAKARSVALASETTAGATAPKDAG